MFNECLLDGDTNILKNFILASSVCYTNTVKRLYIFMIKKLLQYESGIFFNLKFTGLSNLRIVEFHAAALYYRQNADTQPTKCRQRVDKNADKFEQNADKALTILDKLRAISRQCPDKCGHLFEQIRSECGQDTEC